MKKTKKQSSRTLPSMGRVSSSNITRILIPNINNVNNKDNEYNEAEQQNIAEHGQSVQ
jgi:hypothetical protein